MNGGISSIEKRVDKSGRIRKLRITFGPHHFVELHADSDGKVDFWLGATHHGFRADASTVPSELEAITDQIREMYPQNVIDHTPFWTDLSD